MYLIGQYCNLVVLLKKGYFKTVTICFMIFFVMPFNSSYSLDLAGYIEETKSSIVIEAENLNNDTIKPVIAINSPSNGSIIQSPPYFSVNFSDVNFERLWVTFNYSNIEYGFITSPGNNVLIDTPSSIWNLLPEGHFLVRIYVNDTAGNVNYAEITIIKEFPPEQPPEIAGVNLFIIVSCIIGILVMLATKIKKKINL